MTIHSKEDVCGRGKGRRHVGLTSVLVCLGAGGVFSDNSTEVLEIRSIWVTREELRRDDEGVSIATETLESSLGVVRRPRRTQGSCEIQEASLQRVMRAAFKV